MALREEIHIDLAAARREVRKFAKDFEDLLSKADEQSIDFDMVGFTEGLVEAEQQASETMDQIQDLISSVFGPRYKLDVDVDVSGKTEIDALEAAADSLEDKTVKTEVEVEGEEELDKVASGLDRLSGLLPDLPGPLGMIGTELQALGVAGGAAALGLGALVAAGIGLGKVGQQFAAAEASLIVATGATGDALDDLNQQTMDLFSSLPTQLGVAADVMGTVNTLLRSTGDEAEEVSRAFIQLGRLDGGTDPKALAESWSRAFNALGVEAGDAVGVLDSAFSASQRFGISQSDLVGPLLAAGGAMNVLGLTVGESIELLGQLSYAGVDGAEAMNALAAQGTDLDALAASLDGLNESSQVLDVLVEAGFPSEQAARFSAAIASGAVNFNNLGAAADESLGSISDTFDRTLTPMDRLQTAGNQLLTALEPLGDLVLDGLTAALETIDFELLAEHVNNFSTGLRFLIEAANDLGFFDSLTQGFTNFSLVMEIAKGDWLSLVDLMINGLDIMLGPLNEMIARIPGMGDPIESVRDKWEDFRASMETPATATLDVDIDTAAAEGDMAAFFERASGGAISKELFLEWQGPTQDFNVELEAEVAHDAEQVAKEVEAIAAVVQANFGDPFTPRIEEEDIEEYLDRVIELQERANQYRTNLLDLQDALDSEQFEVLLEAFEAVGEEAASEMAAELVSEIGSVDFDEVAEKLSAIPRQSRIGDYLANEIAEQQIDAVDVPVVFDVDQSEIDEVERRALALNTRLEVDDSELTGRQMTVQARIDTAAMDRELQRQRVLRARLEALFDPTSIQRQLDSQRFSVPLHVTSVVTQGGSVIAADGSLRDGGAFSSSGDRLTGFVADNPGPGVLFPIGRRRYIAGEDPQGPENVEYGPRGVAVVGAYHDALTTIDRLETTGVLESIAPILKDRWQNQAGFTAATVTTGGSPAGDTAALRTEIAALKNQIASLVNAAETTALNTASTPEIAAATAATAASSEVAAQIAVEEASRPRPLTGKVEKFI